MESKDDGDRAWTAVECWSGASSGWVSCPVALKDLEPDLGKVTSFECRQSESGSSIHPAVLEEDHGSPVEPGKPPSMQVAVLDLLSRGQCGPCIGRGRGEPDEPVGLPGRVFIVAGQVVFQALVVMMLQSRLQAPCRASENGMFVDLHVQLAPRLFRKSLVLAGADSEKRQLAKRVSMLKGLAHEPVGEGNPKTAVVRLGKGVSEFVHKGGCDPFIRVQKEDPWVAKGMGLQGPVSFFGKRPIPMKLQHLGTGIGSDRQGGIRAAGIDHDDVVECGEATEAGRQVRLFIANWDAY